MRARIMVCGSVGYGGIEEIRRLQDLLRREGFEVLDQFSSAELDLEDFTKEEDVWKFVVDRDIGTLRRADLVVLIASRPSFGAAMEALIAASMGKPVIAYCPEGTRSPWPLYVARRIARSDEELVEILREIQGESPRNLLRVIPNMHGDHEVELEYRDFRCLCPVTRLEDRARLRIRYVPNRWLLEYESLPKYLETFREREMHHEMVVATILEDLRAVLDPKMIEVEAEFEPRSGVRARVRRRYPPNLL